MTTDTLLNATGWTVIHFIWQGAVIGLIAAAALRTLRHQNPNTRCIICITALAAALLTFITTFFALLPGTRAELPLVAPLPVTEAVAAPTASFPPVIAGIWLLGVFIITLRFARQWISIHRLRTRNTDAPDDRWLRIFHALREDLRISPTVRLLRSGLADVPMVAGWLRPVVLVPASAFTSLTPEQMRAVLAHELGHIRRHDHLINMLQGLVEILLFFHPVTWWLSRRLRQERELCCDDLALQVTHQPHELARALAQLETDRIARRSLTLAATNGGPLMQRITRILSLDRNADNHRSGWRGVMALAATTAIAAAGISYAAAPHDPELHEEDLVIEALREAVARDAADREAERMMHEERLARIDKQNAERQAQLDRHTAEIEALLKAGVMTRGEAAEKLAAMEARAASPLNRRVRTNFAEASDEAHIKAMSEVLHELVREGLITPGVAEQKIDTFIEKLHSHAAAQRQRTHTIREHIAGVDPHSQAARARDEADRLATHRTMIESQLAHLHELTIAGELSPEEGHARAVELHQHLAKLIPDASEHVRAQTIYDEALNQQRALKVQRELERRGLYDRMNSTRANTEAIKADLSAAMEDLRSAVHRQELSPDQARDRWIELAESVRRATERAIAEREAEAAELQNMINALMKAHREHNQQQEGQSGGK